MVRIPKGILIALYSTFVEGRFRIIGKPLYRIIVSVELAVHQALVSLQNDHVKTGNKQVNRELTAIIKTYERPEALKRLIRSIQIQYPRLHIIVADDSREPQMIKGVETIILPYNQGATVGRNEALNRVKTKYFLLLDDDFVFYRHTKLENPLSILDSNPQIDILGGEVVDLPFFTASDYRNVTLFPTTAKPTMPEGSFIAGLPAFDMVANFFLGRTERVKLVGWDPNLKNLAHSDFFTRSRGVLTTVFYKDLKILHARTPFDTVYMKDRNDITFDKALLLYRYDRQSPLSENDQSESN
jgi:glycosyltransferase involved in cell wall biosynthesis